MELSTQYIPVHLIEVADERQRKDYGDLEPLKASIDKLGQINPITVAAVNDKFILLAGGRRLAAVTDLGHKAIFAAIYDKLLDQSHAALIELEENLKRKQLDWREEVLACLRLHDMHCEEDPDWNVSNTADVLSLGGRTTTRFIAVGRALQQGNETVDACASVAAAAAAISRQTQRFVDDEAAVLLDNVNIEIGDDYEVTSTPKVSVEPSSGDSRELKSIRAAKHDIHQADFTKWAALYSGPPFQVLHLDPPYGIMHHESEQGGGSVHGTYSDTEDDLWKIVQTLLAYQKTLIAPRCHIIFWFSFKFYSRLLDILDAGTWSVNPFPLIWWKKDNIGLVPDAKRYGRRVYETAFLISVGDRQINSVRPNLFAWESGKARAQHLSEKPEPVVNYFLSSLIDPERKVHFLDPTCGSGSALSAAERLGALSVTGLDIDPVCVESSCRVLNARRLRSIGRGSEVESMTDNQLNTAGE